MRFAERIFAPREIASLKQMGSRRIYEFLAGRFAVKEACAKALGTGFGSRLSWRSVVVGVTPMGAPCLEVNQALLSVCAGLRVAHVSITHEAEYAMAYVILEG